MAPVNPFAPVRHEPTVPFAAAFAAGVTIAALAVGAATLIFLIAERAA